ncbi:MAG: hypothetical protein ACI9QV_000538 [Methylophagaceae bacterium]|jgi:hypothetical protein
MTAKISRFSISALISLILMSTECMAQEAQAWSLDGSYRLRYESSHNAYRAEANGGDQILVSRLLVSIKGNRKHVFGELEIADSRSWLDNASTPLGIDDINSLEPLQAWIGWRLREQFAIKAGRLTLDIGSRRFVSRNRFRNTLNTFDGIYGSFQQDFWQWQAFFLMPVDRQPSDRRDLDNNDIKLDKHGDNQLWGLHLTHNDMALYYYGLDEDDDGTALTTVGFRTLKAATIQQWHYELEAAYQAGKTGSLNVSASMIHAHVGYQFPDSLSSRVELMVDYASGDNDPTDGESNRFNTLFGARRFDFGPTGIFGAFARTNIISPGMKWDFKPNNSQATFIAYRAVWLDSATDLQFGSGLRDMSGSSGRFVGHQLEARWRINFTTQWQLELGGAYLRKGEFFKNAPNAPSTGDTQYLYSQIVYRL